MANTLSRLLAVLGNLGFKNSCPLCQRSTEQTLCTYCDRQLKSCQVADPSQTWQGSLPQFIWGKYDGTLKRAIAAFKYESHPELGEFLGFELAESWLKFPRLKSLTKIKIIPIPLHPNKLKSRGFNQAELIAESFCHLTRLPLQRQGLIRVKDTDPLFNLDPQQRKIHLDQALQVGPSLQKCSQILLIDDIYTTGATAQEAQRVLQAQGHAVIGIAA
ncbi:MAG: ComF family protein, partial [Microcystaceae cyanobacterium]